MKKTVLVVIMTAAVIMNAAASRKKNENVLPGVQKTFTLNEQNRELGYQITGDGTVVFVFDPALYKIADTDHVYVEGSFNGWKKGTDEAWSMTKYRRNVWTLTKSAAEVRIPGNSGFPEFKFYIFVKSSKYAKEPQAVSKIPGYQMATNNLVLFPGDDPAVVVANTATADCVKKLSDFDLSDPAQAAVLANVRQVPGTTMLWRGYHPYKKSRAQYDTEQPRLELVKKLLETNGIKSIITLSGDEKPSEAAGESISPYEQAIIDAGNELFIDTSYNTVYYHSAEADFGNMMQQIVRFIDSHPGPYYIHCRLGTDRTGVTSAVLAAFCGADWQDIAADYQKTNEMGIKEFRDYRLLQYSFEQMLGKPVADVQNLQHELAAHFVDGGYLTQEEFAGLVKRLTGTIE
ncbi:MAG: tyrosine-protein phosphatase [Treponema sp.]|nr:tyrosine-protein phosphatase [Treponema sp.]